jgi:hypothetical protein
MTPKRTLLALMGAPLLALLVACGGGSNNGTDSGDGGQAAPNPTRPPAAQATATQAPTGGSGDADLVRLANAFSQVRSFKATITVESQGTREQATMEFVMPDRFRMTVQGIQIISIGQDLWMNLGTGWQKQAGAGIGAMMPLTPSDIQESILEMSQTSAVTRKGTDTVGGIRCQIFEVRDDEYGEISEICVADNNLPIRVVSTVANEKTTVIFSDFNANISIQAPN